MSSAPAYTRWYPGTVKPARPGVYQRRGGNNVHTYSYWTGAYWCFSHEHVDKAAKDNSYPSISQEKAWRGLAQMGVPA